MVPFGLDRCVVVVDDGKFKVVHFPVRIFHFHFELDVRCNLIKLVCYLVQMFRSSYG